MYTININLHSWLWVANWSFLCCRQQLNQNPISRKRRKYSLYSDFEIALEFFLSSTFVYNCLGFSVQLFLTISTFLMVKLNQCLVRLWSMSIRRVCRPVRDGIWLTCKQTFATVAAADTAKNKSKIQPKKSPAHKWRNHEVLNEDQILNIQESLLEKAVPHNQQNKQTNRQRQNYGFEGGNRGWWWQWVARGGCRGFALSMHEFGL